MALLFYYYGNLLPTISSVTPSPATITLGSSVTMNCSVADADGTVVSVDYFLDGVLRGTGTTSPSFPMTFTPSSTGNNRAVTAQATDNLGGKSALFTGTSLSVTGANTVPGPMAQPTGLVNSATSITLTYAAPNNGGSAITDYQYAYSSNGGTTFTLFAHTQTTALTQTITGLVGSTAYQFRVAAINAIGTGVASTPDLLLSTPAAAGTITATSSTPS